MVKCPKCGKENPEDALFCGYCKADLKERKEPVPAQKIEEKEKKKVSKEVILVLAIVCVVVIVIIAGLIFFTTFLKDFFEGVEDGLSDNPPYADFSYSPSYDIYSNETIEFFDESSEGIFGSDVVNWTWAFGDGTVSTQQHPTHIYKNGGVYLVSLTVTNKKKKTDTYYDYITVGFSCELEWGKNYTMGSLLVYPESYSFSESSTEGAKYLDINVTVKNVGQTEISLSWINSNLYYRGVEKEDMFFFMGNYLSRCKPNRDSHF